MTYQSFNSEMFSRFPHLKEISDRELGYFGDEEPGCYITFESILVPEIERVASASENEYITQLMTFVEEVASSDIRCRELVQIGLGEWLPSSRNGDIIRNAAGPETQKAIFLAERQRVVWQRKAESSPIFFYLRKLFASKKKV